MRPIAFTAAALTVRYEGLGGVREVDFTVPAGSTAALIGPPGSGKTTIVETMLGLIAPVAGSASYTPVIERAGRPVVIETGRPIGALLQPHGLHPARTVRGQLRVYAAAAGVSNRQVDRLITRIGLDAVADNRIRALPESLQTRLALAVALLGDPPLLVLDDPMTGLDAPGRAWLSDYLRGHARRGGTALLTSQTLTPVLPVTDQLIVLSGGSVVYQGSPRRLRRSHPDRLVVASSSPIALATALAADGFTDAVMRPDGRLGIAEASRTDIQTAAGAARVQLGEMMREVVHPDQVLAQLTDRAVAPATQYGPR